MTLDLVDIEAKLEFETDDAFLVLDGSEDKQGKPVKTWLPKSKVEYDGDGTFTMPEWMALKKELI